MAKTNLLKQIPTNINNNNYYNNNNNTNYDNNLTTNNNTKSCWSSNDQNNIDEIETLSPPLGKPKEKDSVSQSEEIRKLPAAWKVAKWDLFQSGNLKSGFPKLKLKLWFINKRTGKQFTYMSALNTPWDSGRMAYGIAKDKWKEDFHWKMVRKHYHTIKNMYDDVRSSKLAEPNKGNPTEVAVFVYQDQQEWIVDMLINGEVYYFVLDGELSDGQVNTGIIATKQIGIQGKKVVSLEQGGFV